MTLVPTGLQTLIPGLINLADPPFLADLPSSLGVPLRLKGRQAAQAQQRHAR